MSNRLPILFAAAFFLTVVPDAKSDPRNGLSQLDFDKALPTESTMENSENTMKKLLDNPDNLSPEDRKALEELHSVMKGSKDTGEKQSEEQPQSNSIKDKGDREGKKPLSGKAITVEEKVVAISDEDFFIPPSLKGPKSDKDNANQLTSSAGWQPANGSCVNVVDLTQVCDKAKALADVLDRYTGSSGLFDGQVAEAKCASDSQVCVLSDVTLASGGTFNLMSIADNDLCRMRLKRMRSEDHWQVIKLQGMRCSCVPKSCVPGAK